MRWSAIAVAAVALAGIRAPAARAGDFPPYDPKKAHARADTNGDGQVDREEFLHYQVEVFYFSDTDKDGYVTAADLHVFDAPDLVRRGDRNGDGKLSLSEFIDARFEDFDATDTDSNGSLSVDEVVAAAHH